MTLHKVSRLPNSLFWNLGSVSRLNNTYVRHPSLHLKFRDEMIKNRYVTVDSIDIETRSQKSRNFTLFYYYHGWSISITCLIYLAI